MVNINSLERDELRQADLCPRHTMMMNTKKTLITDQSQPGITKAAPTVRHWDVGDKYDTGVPEIKKIRGRENIAVGKLERADSCNEQVSLEHSGALRDALEKLW